MIRRFAILLCSILPSVAMLASEEQPPLVMLNDVRSGTMLLKTTQPGVFVEAPTVETDVRLRVRGLILRGDVTQRFRNPESTCAEAVYAFPLPEEAAVDRLTMTIGVRTIEGEIRKREEATEVYQQARREGRKASLLEQERPNLFTVSIANVGAGEEVTVAISYQERVEYRDGVFRLRFPMTIGPRYSPQSVTDVASITPPVALPGGSRENRVGIHVDLDAGFSLRSVESPYDTVRTSVVSGSRYEVSVDGVRGDHDFELSWRPDLGSEPKAALFTESAGLAKGGAGETYGLLMLMPPARPESARMPRETIFIIDTSGSMGGPSIREAKAALLFALDRLSPSDRFNIIEFNSTTDPLFETPRPAGRETVRAATEWVERLNATGGTEMLPALTLALKDQRAPVGYVRQVIFMTDGQVGNESELFSFIRGNLGESRLFTVGIGSAPNSHFMRETARFGRGTFTYVGKPEEVAAKMTGLFTKLESPVLRDVEVRFDDPAAEVWPQRVPDLYAGEPIVLAVRFANPSGRVILSGTAGGQEWHDVHTLPAASDESGIGKLWARMKIDALSDEDGAQAENSDVKQQIVDLALAHHLVTPLTSLVAVDTTPAGTAVETCETRPVPVMLPPGWGGIEGSLPATATAAPLLLLGGSLLIAFAAAVALRS